MAIKIKVGYGNEKLRNTCNKKIKMKILDSKKCHVQVPPLDWNLSIGLMYFRW